MSVDHPVNLPCVHQWITTLMAYFNHASSNLLALNEVEAVVRNDPVANNINKAVTIRREFVNPLENRYMYSKHFAIKNVTKNISVLLPFLSFVRVTFSLFPAMTLNIPKSMEWILGGIRYGHVENSRISLKWDRIGRFLRILFHLLDQNYFQELQDFLYLSNRS